MTHKRGRSVPGAVPRAVPDVGGPARVTYRGGAAFAWVLVDCLEREGGVVEWDHPPQTGREGWGDVAEVQAQLVVVAAVGLPLAEAVSAGVARFRRRFPDRGSVKIESNDAN
jgi:hypothetical protein